MDKGEEVLAGGVRYGGSSNGGCVKGGGVGDLRNDTPEQLEASFAAATRIRRLRDESMVLSEHEELTETTNSIASRGSPSSDSSMHQV